MLSQVLKPTTPILRLGSARTKHLAALSLAVMCWAVVPSHASRIVRDGVEFQVNTFTRLSQGVPTVAYTKAGDEFVVFWTGPEPAFDPGTRFGIIGQRFTNRGIPIGTEIQANFHPDRINEDRDPAVAASDDGGFVVVWQDESSDDGSRAGIFGRWFDSSGLPPTDEFAINTYTTEDQLEPRIARLSTGEFAVVWTHAPGPSDVFETEIRGRIIESPGVGSMEFVVAENTISGPIAVLADSLVRRGNAAKS